MTPDEKQLVKRVVRNLIEKLKQEKLVLDWRKKPATRADVRITIEKILDDLPPVYARDLWQDKCEATYQHVYESYYGSGASLYGQLEIRD